MFLAKYFPYEYVEDVQSINYNALYEKGIRGIIFDIDNTLVPHGADSTPAVDRLFVRLHALGFKTLLLSNNSEERVLRFIKNIDTLYLCDADKPSPRGFLKAVEMLAMQKKEIVVIGDTTFTDIVGANRAGLASVLVKYIGYYKREKKGVRRNLEKIILWFYSKTHKQHRLGI